MEEHLIRHGLFAIASLAATSENKLCQDRPGAYIADHSTNHYGSTLHYYGKANQGMRAAISAENKDFRVILMPAYWCVISSYLWFLVSKALLIRGGFPWSLLPLKTYIKTLCIIFKETLFFIKNRHILLVFQDQIIPLFNSQITKDEQGRQLWQFLQHGRGRSRISHSAQLQSNNYPKTERWRRETIRRFAQIGYHLGAFWSWIYHS